MSILSTIGDIGKNLVNGAGSIASSLLGGIGSVVGAKMSSDSAERLNARNLKFQQEQNEIERARADSTLQRTVADAHKAGLSAFDAQSVPLGDTSALQNDVVGVSSAMQSLGSAFSSAGADFASTILKSAELSHNKNVDERKLDLAERQAQTDKMLKDSQVEINNLTAKYQSMQNASYDERNQVEIDLRLAQTKMALAQQQNYLNDITMAKNKDTRDEAIHQSELNMRATEYAILLQEFNHNAEYLPLVRNMLRNEKKKSDVELETFAKKLGLEIDNLTIDAIRKAIGATDSDWSGAGNRQIKKARKNVGK